MAKRTAPIAKTGADRFYRNRRKLVKIKGVDFVNYIKHVSDAGLLEELRKQLTKAKAVVKTTAKSAAAMKEFVAARDKLRSGPLSKVIEADDDYEWPHIASGDNGDPYEWPHAAKP